MDGNESRKGGTFLDPDYFGLKLLNITDDLTLCWIFYLQSAAVLNQEHLLQSPEIFIQIYVSKYIQNHSIKCLSISQWTMVNWNSRPNRPLCRPLSCAASTGPTLSYAGLFSTLMARSEFLQYLAYHRPILPTPLAQFSVIYLYCRI